MKFTLFRLAMVLPKKARSIVKLRSKFARRSFVHGWGVNEPFFLIRCSRWLLNVVVSPKQVASDGGKRQMQIRSVFYRHVTRG